MAHEPEEALPPEEEGGGPVKSFLDHLEDLRWTIIRCVAALAISMILCLVAGSYIDGSGPFPERAAILAVVGRFMTDFADMVEAWAAWAATIVDDWPEDPREATPSWATFQEIAGRSVPGVTTPDHPTPRGEYDGRAPKPS